MRFRKSDHISLAEEEVAAVAAVDEEEAEVEGADGLSVV